VFEKNYFKAAIKRKRCLIPATGWYEWTQGTNGKQPHLIRPSNRSLFSFAGIWSEREEDGGNVAGYAILVGPAHDSITAIHNRQPLMIEPDDYDTWLNPANDDLSSLAKMLRHQTQAYDTRPVTKRVNSPQNQDAALLTEDPAR